METGSISAEQLEDGARVARLRSFPLPDTLVLLGYAEHWAISQAFAAEHSYTPIDFYNTRVPEAVILAVPDRVARIMEVCPVAVIGGVLWYATPHVSDTDHRDRLCRILNRNARPMWAPREWVCHAEKEYYTTCSVSKTGGGLVWAKYDDEHWMLVAGNRYREYIETVRG